MSTAQDGAFHFGGVAVPFHWFAVGSTAVLIASYLKIFYYITNVVGGTDDLLLFVAGALVGATILARKLPTWTAFVLGGVLLGGGLLSYYSTVPQANLSQTGRIVADNVALLTGLSILQMRAVGTWALGVAPATAFVPWYLVFRRRYVLAAASGGAALGFFVLTSDAGSFVTLTGMLGILGIIAFGTMARYGGTVAQVDVLAVALVAMVLLSTTVSVVPGGSVSPILPSGGGGSGGSGGLISNERHVAVQGSIELSPKVQYTVTANRWAYWRVAAYDRYTGSNWMRTDGSRSYEQQSPPLGSSYEVRQTFTVEANRVDAMPTAWKPIRVIGNQKGNVRIGSAGSFSPKNALTKGETYSVVSRVPTKSPSQLRDAGTDYPSTIENRYTRLPANTPDRLERRTDEITAEADNPYEEAIAIERWLEENKRYSLDVQKPNGNVADSFVFEMEKGYCVYYATSMVAMLRTQDIPARFVTGYTPGQRVAEDKWVVRGLDAHAWVEVYFPNVGWVRFDPTPSGPRSDAEQSVVEEARANNMSNVDAGGSENRTWTPEPTTTTTTTEASTDENETTSDVSNGPRPDRGQRGNDAIAPRTSGGTTNTLAGTTAAGGRIPIQMPSTEQLLYGGLLGAGLLLTARRTGVLGTIYRTAWVRWQPRDDPETDVERAFDRLEYHLSRKHRERRPGETPREYIDALSHVGVDERARRVGALYEQARYAGTVTSEHADEAVSIVDDIVRESRR
ncbi:transglutaminase TgpA family protein [Haladaptatus halobius]|uniref:transglutaminase TgpA family protein n=1 Tax=Haladaptatus halobius TaxID=2884875 RepID=UPI001D0A4F30|nr:transglutaminaseTgpA domain-containing protein [Haladaptatus halobius]